MALSQLGFAIACRSQRLTMPELGLLPLRVVTLSFAQPVFEVATHRTWEWLPLVALSFAPVMSILHRPPHEPDTHRSVLLF